MIETPQTSMFVTSMEFYCLNDANRLFLGFWFEFYLTPAPGMLVVKENIDMLPLLVVSLHLQLALHLLAPARLHVHLLELQLLMISTWIYVWHIEDALLLRLACS